MFSSLPTRLLSALLLLVLFIPPAAAEVAYTTDLHLSGLDNSTIATALHDASRLVSLEDRPPATADGLRRRAEDDLPRLTEVMHAEGYWMAEASYVLDLRKTPATVAVTISPGPLFHYGKIVFNLPSGEPAALLDRLGPTAFGLDPGAPARSAPVEAANEALVEAYARDGHPFAKLADRHAVVDVATHTMDLTYIVDPGPPARFGGLSIDGLHRVDQAFVARGIAWRAGEPYDSRKVDATRQDLVRSGLFSAVRITHADKADPAGLVPMTIAVTEGPPRSVGAGVGYNTNLGLGARAFWQHRNLFGQGENLTLSAGAAQRQLGLAATFRRPDLALRGQDLISSAELLREHTDAYISQRARVYAGLEERQFSPYTLGGGLLLDRAHLTDSDRDEDYLLLGTPVYLRRDTTDSLLDPTLGSRSTLTLTPYHSLSGRDLNFLSSRIEDRVYHRIGGNDRMVLAGYAALGSIVGADLAAIPVDKRLYAGGAGSVRGYGYQLAGPLDASGKPIGGRSSLELGVEFRYRFTESLGIAPFIEAGNVYHTSLPNSVKLFYGGGIGLRYYTIVGPIRLDLAFPFEKRPTDSPIQVYISLGQAF
jgi:translocation and assembly module TamA